MSAGGGVGLPALPCDRTKCQACEPEKIVLNTQIAKSEHAFLKREARHRAMTLTGVLREIIRAEMLRKGSAT